VAPSGERHNGSLGDGEEAAMDDVDAFTATVVPLLHDDIVGLHNGDIGPRLALWSPNEPVTLFGGELTGRGWDEVGPAFERLAASFTGSQSCEYEVLAAGASGDLGYVVAIEHSVAASYGGEPEKYALRVTTIFRRENGAWKVVHRHGDPKGVAARDMLANRARVGGAADGETGLGR
jgi:ketosteroid isomerase-like protein